MKKTIVITCVGSLMGVALLSAVADDPAPTSTSPRARSLYQEAPPWAQPNSLSAAVGLTAAEEDEASCEACLEVCEDAQPASDVVTAGGDVAAESEEPAVVHASEESAENEASDIVQVQGTTRGLYGSDDRLIRPISTQSPTRSGTSLHPEPATSPEPASDFSWATPSTVPAPAPQGNPFARQPAATFPSAPVDSTELPAPPAAPISAEESQISTPAQPQPSRFTVTQGASSAPEPQTSSTPRGVVVSSFTSSETVGQSQAPDVRLEWRRGGEINVGQETTCLLAVHNHGSRHREADRSHRDLSAFGTFVEFSARPRSHRSGRRQRVAVIVVHRSTRARQRDGLRSRLDSSGARRDCGSSRSPFHEPDVGRVHGFRASARSDDRRSGERAGRRACLADRDHFESRDWCCDACRTRSFDSRRTGTLSRQSSADGLGIVEPRRIAQRAAGIGGSSRRRSCRQRSARADASLVDTAASQLSVIAPNLIAEIDGPGCAIWDVRRSTR